MAEAIAFYALAALILALGVMVITAKSPVHSVLFLVANFLCVAALYVALGAQFLAVIQVIVYAGGIVVLYLFVVMLVNLKRLPEAHRDPRRRTALGSTAERRRHSHPNGSDRRGEQITQGFNVTEYRLGR